MAAKKPEKPSAKKTESSAKAKKPGTASKNTTKEQAPAAASRTTAARKGHSDQHTPAGSGAKAVPPVRHERMTPTPPARNETPQSGEAPPPVTRRRPARTAGKDIYSPATGTASSDPFPGKELDKFRQMIQELRAESIEELEVLTDQLREMTADEVGEDNSAYSLHMAEQGTDAMEREKTFLQAQRTSDYIKKLAEALERIDNGSFGLCRICGLRLDSKRLMAVPVTQVCTVYKTSSKPCEPGRLHMQELGINEEDLPK